MFNHKLRNLLIFGVSILLNNYAVAATNSDHTVDNYFCDANQATLNFTVNDWVITVGQDYKGVSQSTDKKFPGCIDIKASRKSDSSEDIINWITKILTAEGLNWTDTYWQCTNPDWVRFDQPKYLNYAINGTLSYTLNSNVTVSCKNVTIAQEDWQDSFGTKNVWWVFSNTHQAGSHPLECADQSNNRYLLYYSSSTGKDDDYKMNFSLQRAINK